MSSLSTTEKLKFEKVFGMSSGYVMSFSDRTFSEFVMTAVRKDIYAKVYEYHTGSKANRLRRFWEIEDDKIVGKLSMEMLDYLKTSKQLEGSLMNNAEQNLFNDCISISKRLSGLKTNTPVTEDEFIQSEFKNISLDKIGLEAIIINVIDERLIEIKKSLIAESPLGVIFLCGSTLEGLLLGVGVKMPYEFNAAKSSPKDKQGKVLPLHSWTLSSLIDVSCELKLLDEDVKKFSHALRGFRNYIHPYEQVSSGFSPSQHTAEICWKVLQAAIVQLSKNKDMEKERP